MIIPAMYFLILLAEVINILRGCKKWTYSYKYGKIYMYSDFIIKDKNNISFLDILCIYVLCYFFYLIVLIQIIITIVFIMTNVFFKVQIIKKSHIYNIFLYLPFLMSQSIKVFVKNINKKIIVILFVNYVNIYMWGFPRVVINHAYISLGIIKSFKDDPEKFDVRKLLEILDYIYNNIWDTTISKLEKINTL